MFAQLHPLLLVDKAKALYSGGIVETDKAKALYSGGVVECKHLCLPDYIRYF